MRISYLLMYLLILAVLTAVGLGCSGGGSNPVAPEEGINELGANIQDATTPEGRVIWGAWTLGIDPAGKKVDVIFKRDATAHFDVKSYVLPPTCSDCFKAKFNGQVAPNTYSIDVTLRNPTGITGYDIRGTVFNTGTMELRNPDSYTLFLSPPGDTTPNPFVAYDTGVGQRAFPGFFQHTEELQMFNLNHPNYNAVDYVVDASWPGNAKEPYSVTNMQTTGSFADDGSNSANISVDVFDWQDDVESVSIDLTVLGGDPNTQMTNFTGNTWTVADVFWQAGGNFPGTYKALITARTAGTQPKRETYNYVDITITGAGGPEMFLPELSNHLLEGEHAPGASMDLAVIGDDTGASYTLVSGPDVQYHYWDSIYDPGTAALYGGLITPFEPLLRFDNASLATPEDLLTWVWVEINDEPDLQDPNGQPPFNTPISWWTWIYWWDVGDQWTVTGWIFSIDPDQLPPIDAYIEPFDACGGFNRDGLQYWGSVWVDGDETLYPYVGAYGFVWPYGDSNSFNFLGLAPEGSGPGNVDRTLVNGMDIDDIEGFGEVYVAFSEGGLESAVEIFKYDFDQALIDNDFEMPPHLTINPTNEPIDIEMLPMKNLGQDSDWICVLTAADNVEVYKISDGSLVTMFGDPETISGEARYLDVDDLNYKVHIMQDGPQVSVFYYNP